MNSEERNQLLRILKDFEDLFDGTLGDWDTDNVDLGLKSNYKPLNFVNKIRSLQLTRRSFAKIWKAC